MYADPKERLQLLKGAVDEANGRLRTALFTFVSAGLYLAVTAAATTDRDLLLGRLYNLPIFNVALPILGFYLLAPAVYAILHVTLLAQIGTLARRTADLAAALAVPVEGGAGAVRRADLRLILRLAVPAAADDDEKGSARAQRLGTLYLLLLAVAALAVLPLAVLVLLHWKFLAYQDAGISAAHAVLILLDAVAVLAFTLSLREPAAVLVAALTGAKRRPARLPLAAFVLPACSFALAAGWLAYAYLAPGGRPFHHLRLTNEAIAADPAAGGIVDDGAVQQRLAVFGVAEGAAPGDPLAGPEVLRRLERGAIRLPPRIDLRGRSLRDAELAGARLAGADLSCADLSGADLRHADLRGAVLRGTLLRGARLDFARMQLADLTNADLREVQANLAQLEGAAVHNATFARAGLAGAHLQFLRDTDPAPASEAIRTPADAGGGGAQGAAGAGDAADVGAGGDDAPCRRRSAAHRQPPVFVEAFLKGAQFQGTDLTGVDLRDANLYEAQLQGIDVRAALTQGAVLTDAVASAPDEPARLVRLDRDGAETADACTGPVDFSILYYYAALTVDVGTLARTRETVTRLRAIEAGCRREGG